MAAPKGHKKWGGRKKGSPNKRTLMLQDYVGGDLQFDTPKMGIEILNTALDDYQTEKDPRLLAIAEKIWEELMSYQYPKRKPIDSPIGDVPEKESKVQTIEAYVKQIKEKK